MNLAFSQFQDAFNGAAKAAKEKAICLISKNIEDRMNNRWIWFEVTQQDQPEAMNRDLASVTQFQNQHVIDIKPLPTIVIVNYNEHEFDAVREIFDHDRQNFLPDSRDHLTAFNLGICGKFEVKHVYYSNQGYIAGYTSADNIYKDFKPYAILPVGIGYASVDEIKIGDVLVPKFITDANNTRVTPNGDTYPTVCRNTESVPSYTTNYKVNSAAWSPDGKFIASASSDGTIRLWDPETGEYRATLEGHNGRVNTAAWSPDGKTIASAGCDGTIRIWDVATAKCWYIETFPNGDYAVWNQDQSLRFASEMAWQYLGWQTMVNGKLDRLPAELFGRLPTKP